ncbi:hypothetical protein QCA50_001871 [Cerrena zonata]|uniref:WW domain-containing protein n=1 Tax=Cerrena zonata TaxID=2478898 RepID=A0AAW0GVW0_9APHY
MSSVTETTKTLNAKKSMIYPTTADKNTRYEVNEMASGWEESVESSSYGVARFGIDLPEGWTAHLHPEGAVYYVNAKLRTVTNTHIQDGVQYQRLCDAISEIQNTISNLEWPLPPDYEIHLQLDTDSDKCGYYVVDHDKQLEFWFEDVHSFKDLDLWRVSSRANLNYKLQEHYWCHVEYYPHRSVSKRLRLELFSFLRYCKTDILTSMVSTYPYEPELCEELIKSIDLPDEACDNTFYTCAIARIWRGIALHKFQHYYGETYARLNLDKRRLMEEPKPNSLLIKLGFLMLFNMPQSLQNDLELLYLDGLVLAKNWRRFSLKIHKMWKMACLQSMFLIISNGILLITGRTFLSIYPGLASLAFAATGLYSGFNLLEHYNEAENYSSETALSHLHKWLFRGYAKLAFVYALPKALVGWSIILLTTEVLGLAFEKTNFYLIYILGALLALATIIHCLRKLISWITNIAHGKKSASRGCSNV